jgi:hypothetical protein
MSIEIENGADNYLITEEEWLRMCIVIETVE